MKMKKKPLVLLIVIVLAAVCLLYYFVIPHSLIPVKYSSCSCTECYVAGAFGAMTDEKADKIMSLLSDYRVLGTFRRVLYRNDDPTVYLSFDLKDPNGRVIKEIELILKQTETEQFYFSKGSVTSGFASRIINGSVLYQNIIDIINSR